MTDEMSHLSKPQVPPRPEPEPIERETLQVLIDKRLEDEEKKGSDPKELLYAMIGVYTIYGFNMSRASRQHLKRMIVVHSEHVAPLRDWKDRVFPRSLQIAMHDQLKEFETVREEDPAALPSVWRIALEDVLFYADSQEDESEDEESGI